jgi:hypothetical protein
MAAIAVAVVEEPVRVVVAGLEERLQAPLGLGLPRCAVLAQGSRDPREVGALAGDGGGEVGSDQRQERAVGVAARGIVVVRESGMCQNRGDRSWPVS